MRRHRLRSDALDVAGGTVELHGTRDPAALAPDMDNGRLWVVRRPLRDGRYATERLGATGKGMGLAAECCVRR